MFLRPYRFSVVFNFLYMLYAGHFVPFNVPCCPCSRFLYINYFSCLLFLFCENKMCFFLHKFIFCMFILFYFFCIFISNTPTSFIYSVVFCSKGAAPSSWRPPSRSNSIASLTSIPTLVCNF